MKATAVALLALGAASLACAAPIMIPAPAGTPTREGGARNGVWRSLDAGLDCGTCVDILTLVQVLGENATTLQQFVTLLNDGCDVLFPSDNSSAALCKTIADDLTDVLPWLDKQLETIAWDIPRTFCSVFIPVCTNPCCSDATAPEQVHISLTGNMSEMRVVWVTLNDTSSSTVQWGDAAASPVLSHSATGSTRTYTFGGWLGVIHIATMTGLQPGHAYAYQVGDAAGGWSPVFNFSTLPTNVGTAARPLQIVQIGDMGYGNNSNTTVAALTALAQSGSIDVLLHIGDISYADGDQPHWDIFWRKVQLIAATVPYMTVYGNHEAVWQTGIAYKTRVSMPNENATQNLYYALDIGTLHLYMGNTETELDTADMDPVQLAYLQADLAAANANRNVTPWIIVTGHRPLYCSNHDKTQCGLFSGILREQAEQTYYNAKVDLVMQAHEHDWERSYPVYNSTVVSTSYATPAAPVYVVNGAGGNREGNDMPEGAAWTAAKSNEIGYATVTIAGPHAMTVAFWASSGTQLDTFTITK